MIQNILSCSGKFSNVMSRHIDSRGRASNKTDATLLELFPSHSEGWLNRSWIHKDLTVLEDLSSTSQLPWIIGTHSLEQLSFIQKNINVATKTMGVVYNENLYQSVIKNWCRKASHTNSQTRQIYAVSHPVAMIKFKEKNLFAEFMLTEILNHIDNIPKQIADMFDINISLAKLYNSDLHNVSHYVNHDGLQIFHNWIEKQDALYRFKYVNSKISTNMLGYNQLALIEKSEPISLSLLDQILIWHYCKSHSLPKAPVCNTNVDLENYIKSL